MVLFIIFVTSSGCGCGFSQWIDLQNARIEPPADRLTEHQRAVRVLDALSKFGTALAAEALKEFNAPPAAGDSYPIAIIYSRGLSELSGAFDSYVIAISADSSAISLIAILDSYRVAIAPTDERRNELLS